MKDKVLFIATNIVVFGGTEGGGGATIVISSERAKQSVKHDFTVSTIFGMGCASWMPQINTHTDQEKSIRMH